MLQADSHPLRLRVYGSFLLPVLLLLWSGYCLSVRDGIFIPLKGGDVSLTPGWSWIVVAIGVLDVVLLAALLRPWQPSLSARAKQRLVWLPPLLDVVLWALVAWVLYRTIML